MQVNESLQLSKDEYLKVLQENEDILILKGQLLRPEAKDKQDKTGFYIVFELKVVKESPDNKYQTQFNSYAIVVPAQDSKQLAPIIKTYKNCEVLCVIRPNARLRQGQNGSKFNSVDLYLDRIFLLNDFNRERSNEAIPL